MPELSREPLHELDAMTAAPDHHAILLENDRVRVLDTRLGPGERTPVHSHQWPAALYVLSGSDFVRYDADDSPIVDSRALGLNPARGTALWSAALPPHYVRNVGTSVLHVIATEFKDA
jgi:predicted metal-dependent enzyme (double-stranded beta helix superfamily)